MKYDKALVSNPTRLLSFLKEKRQQKSFRQSIEMSATFLLICFFLIFAIRPTIITISALLSDINSKKDLAEKYKKKINSVIQAQTLYSQAQSDYDLIASSLPSDYNFSQAVTQIKIISQNTSLSDKKIDFYIPEEIDKETKSAYYEYNFSNIIDFQNIQTLLSELAKNRRCLQITNLSLVNQDITSQDVVDINKPKISVDTRFFYWKNE